MPPEKAESMQLQEMVALDWAARLRHLEDLHPRVNALESAVAGLHKDLQTLAEDQKENHKETQQALKDYLEHSQQRIDKSDEAMRGAINGLDNNVSGLAQNVTGLARKVWFFAGAVWVLLGIGGIAFAMRKELFSAAVAMIGAS